MKTLILLCTFLPCTLFSQQLPKESKKWIDESLSAGNVNSQELEADFINSNFSSIWLTKQEDNIGFIGDNYQRFNIHFQKIIINDSIPLSYLVKGKSRVSDNICIFEGEIGIRHIREVNKQEREEMLKFAAEHKDSDLIAWAMHKQFMVLAEYTFKEDKNQNGSGIFKGIIKSYFYIKNNSIVYYDLDLEYSDSFSNNLCVGVWKSYKTGADKKCNWGNYRIPYCGDLDGGAAEFSPIEKYLKYGWQTYHDAYFKDNQEARKEEEKKWWLGNHQP